MIFATVIFIILGIIADFTLGNWMLGLAGLIVGTWAIITMYRGKKNILCGIICIFFTCFFGGFCYLCWDDRI